MTTDQAKTAWKAGVPVIHNGIEYQCISALIYRIDKDSKMYLQLELYDRCGHAVMIAEPGRVEIKEKREGGPPNETV